MSEVEKLALEIEKGRRKLGSTMTSQELAEWVMVYLDSEGYVKVEPVQSKDFFKCPRCGSPGLYSIYTFPDFPLVCTACANELRLGDTESGKLNKERV